MDRCVLVLAETFTGSAGEVVLVEGRFDWVLGERCTTLLEVVLTVAWVGLVRVSVALAFDGSTA